MNRVYVDSELVREFAKALKDFSHHADSSLATLSAQLGRLHGTWRDQEFETFAAQVSRAKTRLNDFARETAKTVVDLERDAEAAAAYQRDQSPE